MATTNNFPDLEFEPDVLSSEVLRHRPVYEGLTFPPAVRIEALEELKTFQIRQDDIFIVTFPKSGTHWVSEIVNLLLADGDLERVNRRTTLVHLEFALIDDVGKDGARYCYMYKMLQNADSPRVITSHLPYRFLPEQMDEKKPKIIYVARNPKDVFTSWFHFRKRDPRFGNLPWDEYFNGAISGKYVYGSWFDHVLEYWNKREKRNVLFLKYEDIKMNARETVVSVAKHLNLTPSDDVVDRVVHSSSLDEMKKMYQRIKTDNQGPFKNHYGNAYGSNSFVRKGKVGDWKNHFSVAENEEFDRVFQEKMKDSGLTFAFE
nr:sulfotransferase 1B1-like [Lytechinus pictus]